MSKKGLGNFRIDFQLTSSEDWYETGRTFLSLTKAQEAGGRLLNEHRNLTLRVVDIAQNAMVCILSWTIQCTLHTERPVPITATVKVV